jgi:mannose-6-phosphate isomerase-like protein (cupin superfamily)
VDEDRGPLVHRDGHSVEFLAEGTDARGRYLAIRHRWTRPGMMAGPHWHPVLTERFVVEAGRIVFRIDGRELVLGPGEEVVVRPRVVHGFRKVDEEPLSFLHEVRPPGRHRAMFELWHRLDRAGKTTRSGVPTNPLDLALLWELQDGYLAGIPAALQSVVLGGLARVARRLGRG